MSMDPVSKPDGVPVSAAKTILSSMAEVNPSSSSGSSSFPIRAPLTIDSDSSSSFGSDNGFDSDGFEDQFDSVLNKPVVVTPDDKYLEKASGDKEFVVSEKIPTGPDEVMSEESNVGKVVVFKPFVAVNGENLVTREEGGDNDVGAGVETKAMGDKILSPPRPSMPPIAKLSRDSDEDSVGSVFEEDDGFWGVARISDISTTETITDSKGQVVGVKEGDKVDESQFKSVLEPEVLGVSISSELVSGVLGCDEEVAIVERDSGKDDILASLVKDEGPDIKSNIKGTVLVESEVSFPTSLVEREISFLSNSSLLDEDVKYSVEKNHGLENMEQVTELHEAISVNSGASLQHDSTIRGEIAVDTESKEVVEGGQIIDNRIDGLRSLIYLDSSPPKAGMIVSPKAGVKLGYITAVGANTVKIVDEEVDYDIQNKEIHKPGEGIAVESEVSFLPDSSILDEKVKYSVKEIHELEDMEQVTEFYATKSINTGASLECDSTTQGEIAVDSIGIKEVVEGCPTVDTRNDELKSVIYFLIDSSPPEADNVVGSKGKFESVDITELGVEAVNTLDEKLFSNIQGEETHETGGDVAMECDLTFSAYEENAYANRNVNLDALCVHNVNIEINGAPVESEIVSPGSTSKKTECILEQGTNFLNGQIPSSSESGLMEDELHCESNIHGPGSLGDDSDHMDVENKNQRYNDFVSLKEGSGSEDYSEGLTLGESDTVKNIASRMELKFTCDSFFDGESSSDHTKMIDEHFVTYSDEDVITVGDSEGKTSFDSTASTALSDAAEGAKADDNGVVVTSAGDSGILFLEHLADLNNSIHSMGLTAQTDHPIVSASAEQHSQKFCAEEQKQLDMQQMRVKYLRLVQRLGLSAESSIAEQVLYRLNLVSGSSSSQEIAESVAIEFEADNKKSMDFSLNILIIGKCGVGKSAIINSIFGEEKVVIDPFEPATTVVKEIVGTIDDITLRVVDTPGLTASLKDQTVNKKILKFIRRYMKKCHPDVVLYVDRLDIHTRDLNDLPLLRSITSFLGSSVWHKTIITLTHASSTPPDGPSGAPLSFEMFVALRSQVIQQLISHAVGDQYTVNAGLTCPVCVVENHSLCKKSRDGQALLPNGETWKPRLLLLCYSMKISSEVNSISKAHITDQLKLFANQDGENVESVILMGGSCDPNQEEDFYQLPPFKPLWKSEIADPSTDQRKTDNRVKLLQTQRCWDYDMGYDSVSLEHRLAVASRFPSEFMAQIKKDGRKFSLRMESMNWRDDITWGSNMQSQFSVGQNTKMALCTGLNSKQSGKLSVKISSSEQLPMALVCLLQIASSVFRNFFSSPGEDYY